MNQKIISIFVIFLSLSFIFSAQAKKKKIDAVYFESGVNKYLEGDFDGAIVDFKKSLDYNKNNVDSKTALLKIYMERGRYYFNKGDYQKARKDFSEANTISPGNETVLNFIKKCKEKLLANEEHIVKEVSPDDIAKIKKAIGIDDSMKSFMKSLKDFQARDENLIKMVEEQKAQYKDIKKMILYIAVGGVVAFLLFLIVFVFIIRRVPQKTSGIDDEKLNAILNKMKQGDGVEFSEKEWEGVKFKKDISVNTLKQALESNNFNRRVEALNLIYLYDANMAFNMITEQLKNGTNADRKVMYAVLGKIKTIQSLLLLLQFSTEEYLSKGTLKNSIKNALKQYLDLKFMTPRHKEIINKILES